MKRETFFMPQKRILVVAGLAALYVALMGFTVLHSNGWGDATRKSATPGCICHNFFSNDSVAVWIVGPDTVAIGSTHKYVIYMTGGPAVAGGYDIACDKGVLSPGDGSSAHPINASTDVTHAYPKYFTNDTVRWTFKYQAPLSIGTDVIYSVGNSVNADANPDMADQWNFGADFTVQLIDSTVGVVDPSIPLAFGLEQNYPNPFNPSTMISYRLEHESGVELSVYNSEGQRLGVLDEGRREAGLHSVTFDAERYASGIYFCRLSAGSLVQVKKMVLVR